MLTRFVCTYHIVEYDWCQYILQEGAKVLVEVFARQDEMRAFGAEAEASERTILEHGNNYRYVCAYVCVGMCVRTCVWVWEWLWFWVWVCS